MEQNNIVGKLRIHASQTYSLIKKILEVNVFNFQKYFRVILWIIKNVAYYAVWFSLSLVLK